MPRTTATTRRPRTHAPVRASRPAAAGALTHFDTRGSAHMVDVGAKPETARLARVRGEIRMRAATLELILSGNARKGDVLGVARLAAIQGAKRTSDLIPLAHPLPITRVSIEFTPRRRPAAILIEARVETLGRTGVEMEAFTAAAIGLLTIYDMCKAVDRAMEISALRLVEKSGGKSGHFLRHGT